jgi:5,10-methylenetetrahydromethanopterin reductase
MTDRFGISRGVSPREPLTQVAETAKAVESLGFEALWFVDHQLGMKDVYAAMNVSAMATEKIHIGTAVTNLVTRHPTVTANATAALDELSEGRAMLGLGAGWVAVHSIGSQPSKLGEVRTGIDEFRQLFSGEEVELYGTTVQLATARRQVPIYLAVSQPGMLRLAGEVCDGAIVMGAAEPEFCKWQLDFIYEGLEKGGRDRSELVIDLVVTMSIDDDEAQAINDVRAWATSQAATFHVWKRMPEAWERFRPEFEVAAEQYHYKDHLSLRAEHKQIVSDEFVRSVAVAGDLETCLGRLREVAALDFDRITFALLSGGRMRRLEELATDVIPRLRSA